jgi:hypothetical protein
MKQIAFHRESDFFEDILEDPTLKGHIILKIKWQHGLLIQLADSDEQLLSYIQLKYGESIVKLCKDRTPIPYVDYFPKKPERLADKD